MSKIMDRVFDLQAVDWWGTPPEVLNQWEQDALQHDQECRCHKCALFFARMSQRAFRTIRGCAIEADVIAALRKILKSAGK